MLLNRPNTPSARFTACVKDTADIKSSRSREIVILFRVAAINDPSAAVRRATRSTTIRRAFRTLNSRNRGTSTGSMIEPMNTKGRIDTLQSMSAQQLHAEIDLFDSSEKVFGWLFEFVITGLVDCK